MFRKVNKALSLLSHLLFHFLDRHLVRRAIDAGQHQASLAHEHGQLAAMVDLVVHQDAQHLASWPIHHVKHVIDLGQILRRLGCGLFLDLRADRVVGGLDLSGR